MASTRQHRPSNRGSALLSEAENEALFQIIGNECYSLVAAIVQLLVASPNPREWSVQHGGAVVLVKDYNRRSYFFRLYDLPRRQLLWEQQLYNEFQLTEERSILMTFEGDACVYGLNFSDSSEAREFKGHIDRRYQKEMEQQKTATPVPRAAPARPSLPPSIPPSQTLLVGHTQNNLMPNIPAQPFAGFDAKSAKQDKKSSKKDKKKKITKSDISRPSNFEHRVHLGWTSETGFVSDNTKTDDPNIMKLMEYIGVTTNNKRELKSMTAELNKIADQYGGLDKVMAVLEKEGHSKYQTASTRPVTTLDNYPTSWDTPPQPSHLSQPPPPPRLDLHGQFSHAGSSQRMAAPPPRPPPAAPPLPQSYPVGTIGRQQPASVKAAAPSPPAPPPPPPPRDVPVSTRAAPPSRGPLPQPPSSPAQTNRPGAVPPPPPPPPPPPSALMSTPPVAPPPPPANFGSNPPSRGNLLGEIQQGVALKSSSSREPPSRAPVDPRSNLLAEIQGRPQLKPVDPNDRRSGELPPQENAGGLADVIRRALEMRRTNIESSDDDESDSDNDDWQD